VSCPRTIALGAYVLGALERDERAELEAHLEVCPVCRAELERLAPLPGLLSRLSVEEAERLGAEEAALADDAPRPERPPGAVLDGVLGEVARQRRRSRLLRTVAVAAAVALVAVAAVGGELLRGGADGERAPAPISASAFDPVTGVRGSAELGERPWGTRVELRLAGVRPGERCRLVARGLGGRTEIAATWRVGYLGSVDVPGAVAIRPERLASLAVVTTDDRVLVRMPVTPN
jgi:hypothetical protein